MKGTVYGNRLPRDRQVKKTLGTTALHYKYYVLYCADRYSRVKALCFHTLTDKELLREGKLWNLYAWKTSWPFYNVTNASNISSYLPTPRDNPSVPSSRVKQPKPVWYAWPLNTRPLGCPETSVNNYQSTQRNLSEEW